MLDDIEGITDNDVARLSISKVAPLNQQQAVDDEAAGWANVWQQGASGFEPQWPEDMGRRMADFATSKFRDSCLSFP